MSDTVYIIAEAGVNHNGDLNLARQLVDVATDAGADAVKFQTFKADNLVSRNAAKAEYQTRNMGTDESQYAMIKQLELDEQSHAELIAHCARRGIEFLSTPFDLESLDLLTKQFDLPLIKLPSGDITNAPLLLAAARTGKPVIVSTGMSTLDEVETALGVLAFGYVESGEQPSIAAFGRAFASEAGKRVLLARVTLLHCTTEYPAPFAEVNLRAMHTLRDAFGLPVGYSDHTPGITIPIAAAAMGAAVIEKHFTLDRGLPGPDHKASLEPDELKRMVLSIREVELALGSPVKQPSASELKNRQVARKSLVALREVSRGEAFTADNLGVKRPGDGVSPVHYWEWLGKSADRDYQSDDRVLP